MRQFTCRTLTVIGLLAMTAGAPAAPTVEKDLAPPAEVVQLLQLMQSPAVKAWLEAQPPAAPVLPALDVRRQPLSMQAADRVAAARAHLKSLVAAIPSFPGQLRAASAKLAAEFEAAGKPGAALSLGLAIASGFAFEGLYRLASARARRRSAKRERGDAGESPRSAGLLADRFSRIAVFAAGALVTLIAFDLPPLMRHAAMALLLATVATRLGLLLAALAFPPRASDAPAATQFQRKRLGLAIGVAAFGWAVTEFLPPLGISPPAREIIADILALAILIMGLEAVLRQPGLATVAPELRRRFGHIGIWTAVYFVLLWLLFVADLRALFWPALLAYALPKSIAVSRRALRGLLNQAGPHADGLPNGSFALVYAERLVRVVLVIGAALLLAHAWRLDLTILTTRDTLPDRLLRGLLSSVVILLVADLLWHLVKTFIDRTAASSSTRTGLAAEAAARHARFRTLLPILRNILFIVIAVLAVLMALSAVGVPIGPLIAGAGVVGVAIGFGAQTIVKDIISGVFYLLDDAFRVGEYIQSGAYSGTVESFSLRSVRLRHPRGGVFTVPFGELGAIENLQRDWAIDKFVVNVGYGTDLAKAKKLVKEVGAALLVDPDVGASFIEPLKLQGVQELGAYSIALRMKMKVRPGEQSTIRRKVLAMIKASFDQNGIKFPFPIVHVEGTGNDAAAAAAQEALRLIRPPAAA